MNINRFAPSLPYRSMTIDVAHQSSQQRGKYAGLPESSTMIFFDIKTGSNAITVTLSDRSSGEILRKLVYDRGGGLQPVSNAGHGRLIDIAL